MLLNLLWIIFGGLWMAVGWMIAAVVMAITIIGLPWTRAAFNIAVYTLLPFGQKAVSRAAYGHNDIGTGPLGILGNVLWLVLAGWWLAVGHLITATSSTRAGNEPHADQAGGHLKKGRILLKESSRL
jgi:uncharacterized membrane protein YccF (DUF307 family)